MPSPVAHSLGGLAVLGVARYLSGRRDGSIRTPAPVLQTRLLPLALIVAAIAPDFDFIPGVLVGYPNWLHRGFSHSFAAAFLFGASVYAVARRAGSSEDTRLGVLAGAGYASHLVLDMFSPDPVLFNGVPLFWPFSNQHFIVPIQVFLEIRRNPVADNFFASLWEGHNLRAVVRELLVLGPFFVLARLPRWLRSAFTRRPAESDHSALYRRVDSRSES